MELKKFQRQVIGDLNRYCQLLNSTNSVSTAYTEFWAEKNVRVGWDTIPPYNNTIENTPHVCFKVPTGGGKTFLACNALKTIFDNLPSKKAKLVVWLVPSEAILTQTLKNLSESQNFINEVFPMESILIRRELSEEKRGDLKEKLREKTERLLEECEKLLKHDL